MELNSKISSPNLRALLTIYSKTTTEMNGSKLIDQSIMDLEEKYLSVHREQKVLRNTHPELTAADDDMVDEEDMYEYIKKKSMIKFELKKLNSEFAKTMYCHYFCKDEIEFIQMNGNKKDECKSYIFQPRLTFDPFVLSGEDFHFRLATSFLNSILHYFLEFNSFFTHVFILKQWLIIKKTLFLLNYGKLMIYL